MTFSDTSRLFADRSHTSLCSALVNCVADPVDAWVSSNGFVRWVDHDNLVELVSSVLIDPVGVENTKVGTSSGDSLLGGDSKRSLVFEVVDTHVCWFTKGGSLWCRLLSSSTSYSDSVDDISLLSLVS